MNQIQKAFSKSSKSYQETSYIQREIAEYLIYKIKDRPHKIVDLGCGDGAVRKLIDWKIDKFLAVDFSKEMLNLHQTGEEIELFQTDFDKEIVFEKISKEKYDILISSSALQWSQNINKLFKNLENLKIPIYLAIFTDKTFNELHKYFGITSPIISIKDILKNSNAYKYEVIKKKIEFQKSIDILKYIKNSGVSGGKNRVSNRNIRKFIDSNRILSLTLEVIYLWKR